MAIGPDVATVTGRVERYLDRLGVTAREPSLAALTELHLAHLERVAFENLDIARGAWIGLEEDAILEKILSGRGGFCYELNGAFAWLLARLGYQVTRFEAQVAREDGGFGIRFDHLTLHVALDDPFLADVGFGKCFAEPVPLTQGSVSIQGDDAYRVRPLESALVLEHRPAGGNWSPEYRFTSEPRALADFEPGCEYHQTSARSNFTKGPIATRLASGGRVTLHRDRLVRAGETTPIDSEADWAEALDVHFGIVLDPR